MKIKTQHDLNGVLIGMLLGDGHLLGRPSGASLIFGHTTDHIDYVEWKKTLISPYFNGEIRTIPAHIRAADGYPRKEYARFSTKFESKLRFLWNDFYKSPVDDKIKVKRVNQQLLNRLTPLGLAIWYMDDGSLHKNNRQASIATHCFTREENDLMAAWFKDQYDIEMRVTKHNSYWYLSATVAGTSKLLEVVNPIVQEIPSMEYKTIIKPYLHNNKGRPAWFMRGEVTV